MTTQEINSHITKFFIASRDFEHFEAFPTRPSLPGPWDKAGILRTDCPPGHLSKKCAAAAGRGEAFPSYPASFTPKHPRLAGDAVKVMLAGDSLSIKWQYIDTEGTFVSEHFWDWYEDLYDRQWRLLIKADTQIAKENSAYNIDLMYVAIHNAIVADRRRVGGQTLKPQEKSSVRSLDSWKDIGMRQPRYRVFLAYVHCVSHLVMPE